MRNSEIFTCLKNIVDDGFGVGNDAPIGTSLIHRSGSEEDPRAERSENEMKEIPNRVGNDEQGEVIRLEMRKHLQSAWR